MYKHLLKILAFSLYLSCSLHAEAQERLFTAEYKGKYSGMTITSVRTLDKLDNGMYSFKSSIKNFLGHIDEESQFQLKSPDHYVSRDYSYDRRILGKSTHQTINFDWDKKVAAFVRADRPEKNAVHKIEQGMLDLSLYQLKLQSDLANGKKRLEYIVVKPNKIKVIEFAQAGNEIIKISDKSYSAIKLQKVNRDDDKETTIWIVPDLHYQIARIHHVEEDGDSYQINLGSFKSNGESLEDFYKGSPAS